jgi:hypothetical protein
MEQEKEEGTRDKRFYRWLNRLKHLAMSQAGLIIVRDSEFWRECFNDGMTPEQAFWESFVEQDGVRAMSEPIKYKTDITCHGNICITVWHFMEPLWLRPPYLSHYRIMSHSGVMPKLLADFQILENGRRINGYKK